MSTKAAAFVTKLSQDPNAMEKFKNDPHGTMAGEDLSAEDRTVLASGDSEAIRNHLGDDGPPGCLVLVM